MRMCIICKKTFEKIINHHLSYSMDSTIEVCEKCHSDIHKTKKYYILKQIVNEDAFYLRRI